MSTIEGARWLREYAADPRAHPYSITQSALLPPTPDAVRGFARADLHHGRVEHFVTDTADADIAAATSSCCTSMAPCWPLLHGRQQSGDPAFGEAKSGHGRSSLLLAMALGFRSIPARHQRCSTQLAIAEDWDRTRSGGPHGRAHRHEHLWRRRPTRPTPSSWGKWSDRLRKPQARRALPDSHPAGGHLREPAVLARSPAFSSSATSSTGRYRAARRGAGLDHPGRAATLWPPDAGLYVRGTADRTTWAGVAAMAAAGVGMVASDGKNVANEMDAVILTIRGWRHHVTVCQRSHCRRADVCLCAGMSSCVRQRSPSMKFSKTG